MQQRVVALLLLVIMLLNGCGIANLRKDDSSIADDEKEVQTDTFLEESVYDFSYEKPKQTPNVLVDRNGYVTKDTKLAFFCGKELPKQFQIVDKNTKEVVFEGDIKKAVYDEKKENYFAVGDFSDVKKQGTYFIRADIIGQSYAFEIGNDIYRDTYQNIIESFYYHRCGTDLDGEIEVNNHQACHTGDTYLEHTNTVLDSLGGWHTDSNFNKTVVEGTKMVSDLLLTYELLYDAPTDASMTEEMRSMHTLLTEVSYEVRFLLKMQNEETGAFYAGVNSSGKIEDGAPDKDSRIFYIMKESDEATAECAAVLAQFGRIYKAVDGELADSCLQAAAKAFTYLEQKENFDDFTYYAACELYKSTGNVKYHQYIKKYIATENKKEVSRFDRKLYGDIAYLTTTYKVDLEYCTQIMDNLMKRAEEISENIDKDSYLVYSENGKRSSDMILESAFTLALVDHIVTSHEYLRIIENQLHYLFGRNEEGVQMISNKGIMHSLKDAESYDLYLQSTLVFILYELIERKEE